MNTKHPQNRMHASNADEMVYTVGQEVETQVGGRWVPATITKPRNSAGNYGVKFKMGTKTMNYVSSPGQLRPKVKSSFLARATSVGIRADLLSEGHKTDQPTKTFQDFLDRHLKGAGFTKKASKQSALYNWEYSKRERTISVSGWHGTGKFGSSKTVFTLYDTNPEPGFKAKQSYSFGSLMFEVDSMDATAEEHNDVIKKMTDYIKKVK